MNSWGERAACWWAPRSPRLQCQGLNFSWLSSVGGVWENTAVLGSWTKEPGFADLWADGFAVYGNVMFG